MKHIFYYTSCLILLFLGACQKDRPTDAEELEDMATEKKLAAYLPAETFSLNDLSRFKQATTAWRLVSAAYPTSISATDFETEAGTGVLLASGEQQTLSSKATHADLELELEYLLTKDAEVDVLFQEKYPLKLADSWSKGESGKNASVEDQLASQNVSRSPGLWQQLKTRFRAAEYDDNGNKVANARLDYVYINDVLVQDSVEFTSNNPLEANPLQFRLKQGQVAIKNIKWKALSQDSVLLQNIRYQLFKDLKVDAIPDFTQLEADETGTLTSLTKLEDLAKSKDYFGLIFEGDLIIPHDGNYLFETNIDDGGDLYIDGNLVIHNEDEPGMGTERAMVELTAGKHELKITFYEEVWFAWIDVQVEGPKTEKQYVASEPIFYPWKSKVKDLELEVKEEAVVQRAFVNYQNEKRTHTISVGHPAGVHYSYDLREGSLLKAWKGKFADVGDMWIDRGESQLLDPLNAVVEFTAGVPLARLDAANSDWPKKASTELQPKGYTINDKGLPTFQYELDAIQLEDFLDAKEDKLIRQMSFKGNAKNNMWHRVARADRIRAIADNWYSIGSNYYMKLNTKQAVDIRVSEGQQELVVNVLKNGEEDVLEYELLW
ncbi:MAG: PA14 domain-containing protein [Bacteroidota bacterium]